MTSLCIFHCPNDTPNAIVTILMMSSTGSPAGHPLVSSHELKKRGQLPAINLFDDGHCLVEGAMYGPEQLWHFITHNSECFNCLCLPGADVLCEPCRFCVIEGQIVDNGESFRPGPCNECSCSYGQVVCHNVPCDLSSGNFVKSVT